MKQALSSLIVILVFQLGCTTDNKTHTTEAGADLSKVSDTNTDIEFEKYLSTLDHIPLPLKHYSQGQLPELSVGYDINGFDKFKHAWTTKPLGILFQDAKTVTLVDCSAGDWGLVPFITTYDRLGNKIDSLGPYSKSGEDALYFGIEYLYINEDKSIVVTDSIKTWSFNADSTDRDAQTMKLVIGESRYVIQKNGRITKNK